MKPILFSPTLRTTMTMLALTWLVYRSEAEMRVVWQSRAKACKGEKRLSFPTAYGGDYHVATIVAPRNDGKESVSTQL